MGDNFTGDGLTANRRIGIVSMPNFEELPRIDIHRRQRFLSPPVIYTAARSPPPRRQGQEHAVVRGGRLRGHLDELEVAVLTAGLLWHHGGHLLAVVEGRAPLDLPFQVREQLGNGDPAIFIRVG